MCCGDATWRAGECCLAFRAMGSALRVEISGITDTQQARLACWTRLTEEAARCQASGVLAVDAREGTLASPGQWQDVLQALDMDALRTMPLAFVGRWPRYTELEVLNLTLIERGFRAQVFDDEAAAERWLRYGEHGGAWPPGDHFSTKARSNT